MSEAKMAARIVLEAIAVLHTKGFELLRIQPGMIPSGAHWRVKIGPASWFETHRPMLRDEFRRLAPVHSTFYGRKFFGWEDAARDDAGQLANRVQERFATIINESAGHDQGYVRWYRDMLDSTKPMGLLYAFADWGIPGDGLHTIGHPHDIVVPFPPCVTAGAEPGRPVDWAILGEPVEKLKARIRSELSNSDGTE
jgi:hypothetical protein